tara:strand:+ start:110 stop:319 length:210 start_codon:yes stop_codon:yes gene_type:complete
VTDDADRGAPLLNLIDSSGAWRAGADRERFVQAARDEDTLRACVACDGVYRGPLACPACQELGEPLEPS